MIHEEQLAEHDTLITVIVYNLLFLNKQEALVVKKNRFQLLDLRVKELLGLLEFLRRPFSSRLTLHGRDERACLS